MKRGRGPKRRTRLRADPGKVREFEARAREKTDRKGRGALVPGQVGEKPPTPTPSPRGRVEFRGPLLAGRACVKCLSRGRSARAVNWHHWVPQQQLRVYVRGLRLDEDARRGLLRRLLHDGRNISPVCGTCHDSHEAPGVGSERFSADDVPSSAREFAAELGPEWVERLRRAYPAAGSSRSSE